MDFSFCDTQIKPLKQFSKNTRNVFVENLWKFSCQDKNIGTQKCSGRCQLQEGILENYYRNLFFKTMDYSNF